MIKISTPEVYFEFVKSYSLVLIHFWAKWNDHDNTMKNELKEIESDYEKFVCFGSVDVDIKEMFQICHDIHLKSVPTLAYYKDGERVETAIGLNQGIKERLNILYLKLITEHQKIKLTTRQIVELLVGYNYSEIENLTASLQLTAKEISEVIDEYGGSLIMPPESAFDDLDIIKINDKNPSEWSVVMNLWTVEEGQSDLSIELTLIDNGKDIFRVELDNIHVR